MAKLNGVDEWIWVNCHIQFGDFFEKKSKISSIQKITYLISKELNWLYVYVGNRFNK